MDIFLVNWDSIDGRIPILSLMSVGKVSLAKKLCSKCLYPLSKWITTQFVRDRPTSTLMFQKNMRTFVKENIHLTLLIVNPVTATLHFSTFSFKKTPNKDVFSSTKLVDDFRYHATHNCLSSALFFILKFEIVSQARNLTCEPPISINKPSHH